MSEADNKDNLRTAIIKAVMDEPEFPGDMPEAISELVAKVGLQEALRIAVALTKNSIRKKIEDIFYREGNHSRKP